MAIENADSPPSKEDVRKYIRAVRRAAGRDGGPHQFVVPGEPGFDAAPQVVYAFGSTRSDVREYGAGYTSAVYPRRGMEVPTEVGTEHFAFSSIGVGDIPGTPGEQVQYKRIGIATRPAGSPHPPNFEPLASSGDPLAILHDARQYVAEYQQGLATPTSTDMRRHTALLRQTSRGNRIIEYSGNQADNGRTIAERRAARLKSAFRGRALR